MGLSRRCQGSGRLRLVAGGITSLGRIGGNRTDLVGREPGGWEDIESPFHHTDVAGRMAVPVVAGPVAG